MSDAPKPDEGKKNETPDAPTEGTSAGDDARDSLDDAAVSALLKKSLGAPIEESAAPPDSILDGVQRKIRKRSRGKFYADGWSTSQSRVNYALVAVAMLVVIAICYFALGPTGFSAR